MMAVVDQHRYELASALAIEMTKTEEPPYNDVPSAAVRMANDVVTDLEIIEARCREAANAERAEQNRAWEAERKEQEKVDEETLCFEPDPKTGAKCRQPKGHDGCCGNVDGDAW